MYFLGIDAGTSSIKVAVIDAATKKEVAFVQYPDAETPIISHKPGWAEQSPETWWEHIQLAILKANALKVYHPSDIVAIGIAYQMHGLVLVNRQQQVLRDSIIWCDSRAVETGNQAFLNLGEHYCLQHLLNSPGNFTASKLAWVKEHEPDLFKKIDKILLPGDFIAMKLTGQVSTTVSALSEGIFWDFKNNCIAADLMDYFGFSPDLIPPVKDVFSIHGYLDKNVALTLGLKAGIPVSYKAGDQPNNAFSLNVMQPGEVAATAGTSGVIYSVADELVYDPRSRINAFAHVNYNASNQYIGVLSCINGAGIMNSWMRKTAGDKLSYQEINTMAAAVIPGSDGLFIYPFGNGAERILENRNPGAEIKGLDLNRHTQSHLFRAAQEGIVFAFRYSLDIMKENNMQVKVVKAGYANLFLSSMFRIIFANTLQVPLALFETNGASGAALGAALGAGIYQSADEALSSLERIEMVMPNDNSDYENIYQQWKSKLISSF